MDKRKYSIREQGFWKIQRAIKSGGFDYSWNRNMLLTGTGIVIGMLLCFLMRIKPAGVCIVVGGIVLLIPIIAKYHDMVLYEEKRFSDAVDYMEYVIYSFLRMPKIMNALEEAKKLCHGRMKRCIEKTVDRIQYADDYKDIYEDAFYHIEQEYGNERMRALHHFLARIEQQGGDYAQSLEVLLEDIRQWAEMVYLLQKERKELQRKAGISILLSVAVAVTMVGLLPKEIGDIAENPMYQVSSVVFLLLGMAVYALSRKSLIRSWLRTEDDSEDVKKAYDYCNNAQNKKGRHYRFMQKKVIRSITKEFPMWIRNVILNMQTENVFVAMQKAVEDISYPLKSELMKTLHEIERAPGSMQAYQQFLKNFQVKQVKTVFLMFYSLNEFGTKEAQNQLNAMIQRNNKLAEQSERLINEEKLGIFGIYMLLPMVIAAGKMLLDMWVFVQQFLYFYSNVI